MFQFSLLQILASLSVAVAIWLLLSKKDKAASKPRRQRGEGLLTVLQASGPGVDIIFVHGLGSEQTGGWSDGDVCWPRDILPDDVRSLNAGIYLFGYDSRWMWDAPVVQVYDLAEKLVRTIQKQIASDRQLLFVAHSHGGLIVKQAIVSGSINGNLASRTTGYVFFGTPHFGSSIAGFAKVVAAILAPFGADGSILTSIEPGPTLQQLHRDFVNTLGLSPPRIWNFYEGRTLTMLKVAGLPLRRLIVNANSATFDLPNCKNELVQRNHKQINKFTTRESEYLQVLGSLVDSLVCEPEKTTLKHGEFSNSERQACFRSLAYKRLGARQEDVEEAELGTCDWLFETEEFRKWKHREDLSSHKGVLWIQGNPGSGKSTILKHLISNFGKEMPTASFFFTTRGSSIEQSPLGMYRSLVLQIAKLNPLSCQALLAEYRSRTELDNDFEWSESSLRSFLHNDLACHERLLLVVDALDECEENEVARVIPCLQSLSATAFQRGFPLYIALSSRRYPRLDMRYRLLLDLDDHDGHHQDIIIYVNNRLNPGLKHISPKLVAQAKGVFMWIVLITKLLNDADNQGRARDFNEILNELPGDLDALYQSLLLKHEGDKRLVAALFMWALFAENGLYAIELYCAVQMELDPVARPLESDETDEMIEKFITQFSLGLVQVESNGHTQFIHKTVIDFLLRQNRLNTIDGNLKILPGSCFRRMAVVSARYIESLPSWNDDSTNLPAILERYPLARHASFSMIQYVESAYEPNMSQEEVTDFLREPWKLERLRQLREYIRVDSHLDKQTNGVYMLSREGAYRTLSVLQPSERDVNIAGGDYGNALQAATQSSHNLETVKVLLERGANVNAIGGRHRTALNAAMRSRDSGLVVKILLEHGADANGNGEILPTPLQEAVTLRDEKLAELLLDNGALVDLRSPKTQVGWTNDWRLSTPLQIASTCGPLSMVRFLIQRGADVNAIGGLGGTALRNAMGHMLEEEENYEIVRLLIEKGADVNALSKWSKTALDAAVKRGGASIVQLLLEAGALTGKQVLDMQETWV